MSKPIIMKFRVLQGLHTDTDPNASPSKPGFPRKDRTYGPGEIISTTQDLIARYNAPGSIKFERVDEYAVDANFNPLHRRPNESPEQYRVRMQELADAALKSAMDITSSVTPEGDGEGDEGAKSLSASPEEVFDSMTREQLIKHAQEEEIDLGGAKSKADILKLVKEHAAQLVLAP